MEKVVRIVKKGEDNSNIRYWLTLTPTQRMTELQKIRTEVNKRLYADRKGLQRVYRVIKRT